MAAFGRMGLKHPNACSLLNRVIDYDEVNAALLKLKDVGAGPDNLPPIVLPLMQIMDLSARLPKHW